MIKLFVNMEQIRFLNSKSTDLDWTSPETRFATYYSCPFVKNPPVIKGRQLPRDV